MKSLLSFVFRCMLFVAAAGLSGCRNKSLPPPPPQAAAPPLSPSTMTQEQPLPAVPPPSGTKVGAPGSDQTAQTPPQLAATPKRPRRKKHPATDPAAGSTLASAAAPAGSGSSSGPSAPAAAGAGADAGPKQPSLGELSAGRNADSKESAQMSEEIRAQDLRLSSIKRPLGDDAETIAAQVRAFLIKAMEAVKANDLDGARTLTTKAKVLLDELSKS